MSRWKYTINLTYINGNDKLKFKDANIRGLVIDNDFEQKIMPTMYITLNIDKNHFDRIVLNASKATMILNINKINIESKNPIELSVYNSVCEYFIDHDINYNKDIDYGDEYNKGRQDIFTEVTIGLMFKNPIEWNKQTNNTTVKDATMMNIVGQYIQNIPTLIEPFTYNETFDQLIIPPHDSLVATLAFLNNLRVFYDTSYRVYFDADALYIVSSSGVPTKMKGDKYDTVRFIVFKETDGQADALGMDENDEAQCYVININANKTNFKKDNDTGKKFNKVQSILNPAIENSMSAMESVQDSINKISGLGNIFKDAVKGISQEFESIPNAMSKIKNELNFDIIKSNNNTSSATQTLDSIIATIQAYELPTLETTSTSKDSNGNTTTKTEKDAPSADELRRWAEQKKQLISQLTTAKSNISTNNSKYGKIVGDYNTSQSSINKILGDITNTSGCFGCVTAINVQDTIGNLTGRMKGISGNISSSSNFCSTTLDSYIGTCTNMKTNTGNAISTLSTSLDIQAKRIKPEFTEAISKARSALSGNLSIFDAVLYDTKINTAQQKNYIVSCQKAHDELEPYMNKVGSIKTNLKAAFTNTLTNIATIGENAVKSLSAIVESVNKSAQKLSQAGLSIGKLDSITKDINSVKDITSLGKLGISSFKMDLNLGKDGSCTGTKIINIDNDNANKLKNIKSDIENNQNQISLRKQDLDFSVFTINKKYVIRNYDTHSDKDGMFLLVRRMDILSREDDKFKCLTQLWFNKIANERSSSPVDGQGMPDELRQYYEEQINLANRRIQNATQGGLIK